jgi:hypothetical protein
VVLPIKKIRNFTAAICWTSSDGTDTILSSSFIHDWLIFKTQ